MRLPEQIGKLHLEVKRRVDNGMLGEIYSASAASKYYRTQDYFDSAGDGVALGKWMAVAA